MRGEAGQYIIRYVAAKYSSGTLWPEDIAERSRADRWMAWALAHLRGESTLLEPEIEIPPAPRFAVEPGEREPALAAVRHQGEMVAARFSEVTALARRRFGTSPGRRCRREGAPPCGPPRR